MKEVFDSLLVHGYTDTEGHAGNFGDRNEMQANAAQALYKAGYVKNIVLAGGKYWGDDKPAFADVMTDRLIKCGVKPTDIISRPETTTTIAEIEIFLEEARTHDWESLASLSTRSHTPRITLDYKKRDRGDVKQIRAERVLYNIKENGAYPHRDFLRRFKATEKVFIAREAVAITFDLYGLGGLGQKFSDSTLGKQFKAIIDK